MRLPSRIMPIAVILALGLAACGGDSGSPIAVEAPADVATDLPGALQEAVESGDLEALEELAGVDLEALQDLDLGSLAEGDLEEMFEGMDDLISSMGGDGTATITVGDVTYTADADVCFATPTEFTLDGPATGSDGSAAWASVNFSITTRAELAEFVDEATLGFMFPEGVDVMEDVSVEVNVGQTSRFGSVDDQPSWSAVGGTIYANSDLEYSYSGGTVRGSGPAQDYNFVAGDFSETFPITFEASCS